MVDKNTRLVELAKEIAVLQLEIKSRQDRCTILKDEVKTLFAPGVYEAGDLKVTVRQPAGRLDETKFKEAYPAAQNAALYRIVPNTTAIKKAIAPDDLKKFQKFGGSSVTVS